MSQGEFTAPCGCMWLDEQLEVPCPAWRTLASVRDRLRRDWPAEYADLRRVERELAEHAPSWLVERST